MKILYDHQIYSIQKFGGISRYFYELIINSKNLFDNNLTGIFSENFYIKDLKKYKSFPIKKSFKGKGRIINTINEIDTKNRIKKRNFDLLHPTYYDTYHLGKQTVPFVLTVYDMIHEIYPDCINRNDNTAKNKFILMTKANHIIAISENTKNDILRIYPEISSEKISVCYLGNSLKNINPIKDQDKSNYILFTGKRGSYKNFSNLIYALAPLLIKYNINLICTGSKFTKEEIDCFSFLNIEDKVSSEVVDDLDLGRLYKNALVFVFPSMYEGFGIPILEAFENGCPAILSESSSLTEIGGDAAVYFNPNSIMDIKEKIDKVLCSKSLREEMILKGFQQMKKFSWKKCAEETYEIYKKVIENLT